MCIAIDHCSDKMFGISSTLFLEIHDGVLQLTRRDVILKAGYIPLHIWTASRIALVEMGDIECEGDTVLFTRNHWRVSAFRFCAKQFMCFSKLDGRCVRRADLSINISKVEYDEICRILDDQKLFFAPAIAKEVKEDKCVTGVPVYIWKYIDYNEEVQMTSSVKFLKLDSCVEHGMNAESAVPDQYNNPPCEMKVFVDSVLCPDIDSLLFIVYAYLLRLEFRMRIKGQCCSNGNCFVDLVRRYCYPSHLRISPQRLLEGASTVKSLFDLDFISYRDAENCLSSVRPCRVLSGDFDVYHELGHLDEL